MSDTDIQSLNNRITELETALNRVSDKWKADCDALQAKVERLRLAGNAVAYELQDTDPDVKFDTIKVWKQAVRS